MKKNEARKIVEGAFGRRPDLPSGKDFVDEVRHGKPQPDQSSFEKRWLEDEAAAKKPKLLTDADNEFPPLKVTREKYITEAKCQAKIEGLIKKIRRKVMNTSEGTSRAARNDLLAFFKQLIATHCKGEKR